MSVKQREILEVNFQLGNGFKPHPCIVLSNNDINTNEDFSIVVMLSSTTVNDIYTFNLNDAMLTMPSKKQCQVRCHLISLIPNDQILKKFGEIHIAPFKDIIKRICSCVFEDCIQP